MAFKIIRTELEFSNWFKKNYSKLGYTEIIRKDNGSYPDYIMKRGDKEIRVELETTLSNFILHKHDKSKVDEIVCIKKDLDLDIPIIKTKRLKFIPIKERVSFTVDEGTSKKIEKLIKEKKYRNKSHFIEDAINLLLEEEK